MKISSVCNDCMNICDQLFTTSLWQCFDALSPDPDPEPTFNNNAIDPQTIILLQTKLQETVTELNDVMDSLTRVTLERNETTIELDTCRNQIQTILEEYEDTINETSLEVDIYRNQIRTLLTEHKYDLRESSIEVDAYRSQVRTLVKDHHTILEESSEYKDQIQSLLDENVKLQERIDKLGKTTFSNKTMSISLPALIPRKTPLSDLSAITDPPLSDP